MNIIDKNLEKMDEIISMILKESDRQIAKWGIQDRHIFEWAMWTTEEFGEFIQAINEYNYGRTTDTSKIIKEGIQSITLLMKMIEVFL